MRARSNGAMSGEFLSRLAMDAPVVGAPMAGGASGPGLVAAVARAGGLGFLAAGYQTPEALADQLRRARDGCLAFGVNVFAPNPVPISRADYRRYADRVAVEAVGLGVRLPAEPVEDDDHWHDKVELLLREPVAAVSFTFGLPEAGVVSRLRRAGSAVLLTVTSPAEAVAAAELGPDALVVQSFEAGGHSGTLTPHRPVTQRPLPDLVRAVGQVTDLPLVGAGGVADAGDLAAATRAGAVAVAVGTALLRTPESGASAVHKAALADPARLGTVVTRAFTGRPARALRNGFVDRNSADAPLGYPALHHLTSPLRRAASAAADPERVHLWAGTGYRQAREDPAEQVVRQLCRAL